MTQLINSNGFLKPYRSRMSFWEKHATVRHLPRRIISNNKGMRFYPISRQALSIHPLLTALGNEVIDFVLIQSMYQFMNEVAFIETQLVNTVAENIIDDKLPFSYPDELKQDMLTVIMDEAYHAYVARDYLKQVADLTKIQPITLSKSSKLAHALANSALSLPAYLHDTFTVIAVCISENTLTKELMSFVNEPQVDETFVQVMKDHLSDEGRHSGIFSDTLNITWQQIAENDKSIIASVLPTFIDTFLSQNNDKEFAHTILTKLGISKEDIKTIIEDTYIPITLQQMQVSNPVINNILSLMKKNHLLANNCVIKYLRLHEIELQFYLNTAPNVEQQSLDEKLTQTILKYPNNTAIQGEEWALSYAEMDAEIERLAYNIQQTYPSSKQLLIAICLPTGKAFIIAILAVLRAGHAYLPICANTPRSRLQALLETADINYVITNNALKGQFPLLNVLNIEEGLKKPDSKIKYRQLEVDDLAYVLFTSGSTGVPKGVMVQHSSVLNLIRSVHKYLDINAQDTILQFFELTFDVSIAEIFMALLSGATLVLSCRLERTDPDQFVSFLQRKEISIAITPPAFLELVPVTKLPALRKLIITGDAGNQALFARWQEVTDVINAYGPTEATVWATMAHFSQTQLFNNLGFPIENVCLYVLNQNLQQVNLGEIGELYLGGDGLALGYLNDTEKTKNVFINNPFKPGNLLYYTGDTVKLTENKEILFLGRTDKQVKIRGYRVELPEIEAALLCMSELQQVALVVATNKQDREIICFYRTEKEATSVELIRNHLSKYLPEYMIPSRFIRKDILPLSSSGKINYQELAQELQFLQAPVCRKEDSKMTVLDCFKQILNTTEIDLDTHFYYMGGDSLKAIRLINLLNGQFNCQLTIKSFADVASVNAITRLLEDNKMAQVKNSIVEEF